MAAKRGGRTTRGEELRRSTASFLAVAGDAVLRGPLPRALLLITVVVLELTLAAAVKTNVLRGRRCAVMPSAVKLGAFPTFVPEDVAADLRRPRDVAIRSVADVSLEVDLRAAYEGHPWVRRVATVRRVFPSRAVVELELRRPFAWIEVEAWRLTVDAEGVVLDDRASRAPEGLPAVRGDRVVSPRIPAVGGVFRAPAILRGLALLRELKASADHPFLQDFAIVAVDATKAGGANGGDLSLLLQGGARVEWGAAWDDPMRAAEPPTFRKLDALLEATAAYPGLRGVDSVNVFAATPFVRTGG